MNKPVVPSSTAVPVEFPFPFEGSRDFSHAGSKRSLIGAMKQVLLGKDETDTRSGKPTVKVDLQPYDCNDPTDQLKIAATFQALHALAEHEDFTVLAIFLERDLAEHMIWKARAPNQVETLVYLQRHYRFLDQPILARHQKQYESYTVKRAQQIADGKRYGTGGQGFPCPVKDLLEAHGVCSSWTKFVDKQELPSFLNVYQEWVFKSYAHVSAQVRLYLQAPEIFTVLESDLYRGYGLQAVSRMQCIEQITKNLQLDQKLGRLPAGTAIPEFHARVMTGLSWVQEGDGEFGQCLAEGLFDLERILPYASHEQIADRVFTGNKLPRLGPAKFSGLCGLAHRLLPHVSDAARGRIMDTLTQTISTFVLQGDKEMLALAEQLSAYLPQSSNRLVSMLMLYESGQRSAEDLQPLIDDLGPAESRTIILKVGKQKEVKARWLSDFDLVDNSGLDDSLMTGAMADVLGL